MTIPEALAAALEHHRAGRLYEAEQLYRRILGADQNHADSLHLLGVIAHQNGHHDAAQELIVRAIAIDGRVPEFHNNLGEVLRALSRLPDAIERYRHALALRPEYETAAQNLERALAAAQVASETKPTELDLYRALVFSINAGQTGLRIDPERIRHMDCPVAGAAYHTLNVYVVSSLCLVILWYVPVEIAGPAVAAIIALNWFVILPFTRRRMQAFVRKTILLRFDLWQAMWKFGGVDLSAVTNNGTIGPASCRSPGDDWRRFAASLLTVVQHPAGEGKPHA